MSESTIRVENEDGQHIDFTVRFAVFRFDTDALAEAAWVKAKDAATGGVSVWRLKEPLRPPHRHHIVVCGCESPKDLRANARRIKAMPGAENHELPKEMLEALAKRRIQQALDALASRSGKIDGSKRLGVTMRQVIRTPGGRVMYRDGTMEPFQKGQG